MRHFSVDEPVEINRINDNIIKEKLLLPLYFKLKNGDIVNTGANASQADGQDSYIELIAKQVKLDPFSPYVYINKNFTTSKKYVKAELEWYKSMDLSIKNHPGIGDNPTWQACATKDGKDEINSNYGWCVFSEENGSQYDNCLTVLIKDKTSRNAIVVYNRPSIYADYKRDGMHDMICTMYSHFLIRETKHGLKLYMVHNMRSNDIKFGFIGSDLAWNCFVYQNMLKDLSNTYTFCEKTPGYIIWTSDSMHLYSRHYQILREWFENESSFHDAVL